MSKPISLRSILKDKKSFNIGNGTVSKKEIEKLQLKMLRIQQGIWHKKARVIIVFEGFDAAGKGGAIRKLTEMLDPRGFKVHPIGPPTIEEQGKHWLYRFWSLLPSPGTIAIFDRSGMAEFWWREWTNLPTKHTGREHLMKLASLRTCSGMMAST